MNTTTNTDTNWLRRRPAAIALASLAVLGGAAAAVAFWPHDTTDTVRADAGTDTAVKDTTATTAPPVTTPPTTAKAVDLATVNWNAVKLPISCGSTGTKVLDTAISTPQAGHQVAVVLAACNAGAGSPPRSIFVFDGATSASQPHLLQTLSTDGLSKLTGTIRVDGASIVASGSTYSADAARCCPDGTFTSHWTWSGSTFSLAS